MILRNAESHVQMENLDLSTNIVGLQGFVVAAANLVCVSYAYLGGWAGMSQRASAVG